MKPTIKIDFVSDVACPWCAVGLGNLNQAMAKLSNKVNFDVHFRPFELNPKMPHGGQDAIEHLTEKYGLSAEQVKANQANIRAKALEAGFEFHPEGRKRVYNTFNAHRLLFWASKECSLEKQAALKKELLNTYFCLAVSLDDQENLLEAVSRAGLDRTKAQQILSGDEFTQEVRDEESTYTNLGINSVPSIILNDQYLLQGAQPVEQFIDTFEQLIKQT
ncbi:disulfide bond formation protein DsbA [Polynucleobacter wuianus]|uniref:Disulfide bond formation protein DsbA n=1 Tax=Polynucleobacter wuianus TaxID=1743168 RepID=A0A191UFV3_9BURK|nr:MULTISPECIES: DsbA family oxidoreductase [Polynucleobacter]ANI99832.1 disulfide bond formation protein DsbA [Polynucleobacter wuianus]MBU3552650.1 DsbA family oxidoreductase [Polynucleobacter sp. MWH-Post4-6-1]